MFPTTSASLARALAAHGYSEPTPVQRAVLAEEARERDLLVSSQTGSGKTVAYGLALGDTLLGADDALPAAGKPLALIIAPTRELALQVDRELHWLYQDAGARLVSCVGGMDPRREARRLEQGVHIVVGTPGRLRDHLQRGALDVSQLRAVVLDEADEMLDLGFREDLEFILGAMPESRRTLLFSATLPKDIITLTRQFQRDAHRIAVAGPERAHADIEYRAIRILPHEIEHAVVNVLRQVESPSAIVFCNTRNSVRHMQSTLLERGFSAVALSGELGQSERNQALQALRDGRARVCVATDVAARGIDLPSLGLVIHAELPNDPEVMQHRSGRTGRAGRKGISVLMVPRSRRRKAENLMADAGIVPVWSGAPTPDDIRALDEQRLLAHALWQEDSGEDDAALARRLIETHGAEGVAQAFVRLYRSRLPAAEEVTDPGESRAARPAHDGDRDRPQGRKWDKDAPRPGMGDRPAWFRLDIGRRNNADPKWLLPMLCRRGGISRQDIGAIRIFERETKFQIAEHAVPQFVQGARKPSGKDDIRIELLADEGRGAPEGRAPRGDRPFRERGENRGDARTGRDKKRPFKPKRKLETA